MQFQQGYSNTQRIECPKSGRKRSFVAVVADVALVAVVADVAEEDIFLSLATSLYISSIV